MKRDLASIARDFEPKNTNNDIIIKKNKLEKMFMEDPDLQEILGTKEQRPLNKYIDKNNPTEEEIAKRAEIVAYNERIKHKQIIPFLKLNGIQQEVLNFIMFEIDDIDVARYNNVIKTQQLIVMCLVHEDDMETEYKIVRTDLLSYIVKDLLCWSNSIGFQLKCVFDRSDIIDSKYYCRTLKFNIETPNNLNGGGGNKYDKF